MSSASIPPHPLLPESTPFPQSAEIVSGGKRFPVQNARFIDLGPGEWQLEFHVGTQTDTVSYVEIVRGGGGALMLSIDGGPVVGALSRLRPRYQTIMSQPMRYEFAWP